MYKFYVDNDKIYVDIRYTKDKKGTELPLDVICDILNTCEQYSHDVNPSDCIDFQKYKCKNCGKKECGHSGSWNKEPYIFFCSKKCHDKWITNKLEKEFEVFQCKN